MNERKNRLLPFALIGLAAISGLYLFPFSARKNYIKTRDTIDAVVPFSSEIVLSVFVPNPSSKYQNCQDDLKDVLTGKITPQTTLPQNTNFYVNTFAQDFGGFRSFQLKLENERGEEIELRQPSCFRNGTYKTMNSIILQDALQEGKYTLTFTATNNSGLTMLEKIILNVDSKSAGTTTSLQFIECCEHGDWAKR